MSSSPQPTLTPDQQKRATLLLAYEKRTNVTLSLLALVYLITYSIQTIWYEPNEPWYGWLVGFGNILWLLFALDLAFRFILSPVKRHFFRKNWLDTITVVVPQFRALRALRAFTPNGILARAQSKGVISGGAAASAGLAALLVIWIGSLMVLSAERGAKGADIETIGEAVWWSFETITTVGYGDFVPVTETGRFFAVLIMLVGISVLGAVTATLSASLVKSHMASAAASSSTSTTSTSTSSTAAEPTSTSTTAAEPASPAASGTAQTSDASTASDLQHELAEIKAMLTSIQKRLDEVQPTT